MMEIPQWKTAFNFSYEQPSSVSEASATKNQQKTKWNKRVSNLNAIKKFVISIFFVDYRLVASGN